MKKVTILGCSTFKSNKTGNPCFVVYFGEEISKENSKGLACYSAFVAADEYAVYMQNVGKQVQAVTFHHGTYHQIQLLRVGE